jgi:hypothetical protein
MLFDITHPSLSVNTWQHKVCQPVKKYLWRNSSLCPESDEGLHMAADDSSSSHQSFGANTELSRGQDGSNMDLPSSPEAQDDKDMDADWDTSSS